MLIPSQETLKIRSIVESLSDDEMRSMGPGDFREPVEAAGLAWTSVRDKVNNELARERRKRGIHKGRGRKQALDRDDFGGDKMAQKFYQLFGRLGALRDRYGSLSKVREVIEDVIGLLEYSGTQEELMSAIKIMQQNEDDENAEKRSSRTKNRTRPGSTRRKA